MTATQAAIGKVLGVSQDTVSLWLKVITNTNARNTDTPPSGPGPATVAARRNKLTTIVNLTDAYRLAEWPNVSDRQIAEICAVGYSLVAEVRQSQLPDSGSSPQPRIGKDGKTRKPSKSTKQSPAPPPRIRLPKHPQPYQADSSRYRWLALRR